MVNPSILGLKMIFLFTPEGIYNSICHLSPNKMPIPIVDVPTVDFLDIFSLLIFQHLCHFSSQFNAIRRYPCRRSPFGSSVRLVDSVYFFWRWNLSPKNTGVSWVQEKVVATGLWVQVLQSLGDVQPPKNPRDPWRMVQEHTESQGLVARRSHEYEQHM